MPLKSVSEVYDFVCQGISYQMLGKKAFFAIENVSHKVEQEVQNKDLVSKPENKGSRLKDTKRVVVR